MVGRMRLVVSVALDMKSLLNSESTLKDTCCTLGDKAPHTDVFPANSSNKGL